SDGWLEFRPAEFLRYIDFAGGLTCYSRCYGKTRCLARCVTTGSLPAATAFGPGRAHICAGVLRLSSATRPTTSPRQNSSAFAGNIAIGCRILSIGRRNDAARSVTATPASIPDFCRQLLPRVVKRKKTDFRALPLAFAEASSESAIQSATRLM